MQKLLIFNTKYKYGGEDANIKEEINFYKNLTSPLS